MDTACYKVIWYLHFWVPEDVWYVTFLRSKNAESDQLSKLEEEAPKLGVLREANLAARTHTIWDWYIYRSMNG